MPWTSTALRRGEPQNVHGPRPSLTQITFPQFKQLGAAVRRGWRAPMQLHARFLGSICRLLFVLISSDRIAASRSLSVADAPCIDVPPVMFIFVVFEDEGAGEDVRVEGVLLDLKSPIRAPAAEGGGLVVGAWIAEGVASREKALPAGVGFCDWVM